MSAHADIRAGARVWGPFPEVVLGLGVVAAAAQTALLIWAREWGDPLWTLLELVLVGLAVLTRSRRPDLPASCWFALMAGMGPITSLAETSSQVSARESWDLVLAWSALTAGAVGALTGIAAIYLIGLFPEGRVETRGQRLFLASVWVISPLPLLVALSSDQVADGWYVGIDPVDNPLQMLPPLPDVVVGLAAMAPTVAWVGAFVMLGIRYRRATAETRRSIRWLLLPIILLPLGVATELLLGPSGSVIVWLLWMTVMGTIGFSVTFGILQPARLDVDFLVRRTLVYGALWLAITAAYVGVAALVGAAAGRYLPVAWAVAIAVVAGLLFQPARARLERLADRWVFGHRTDQARVIADLGNTLAETFDLEALLPRMSAALQEGLGLAWARVRLDSGGSDGAELVTPVVLDGEQIGAVECGPKLTGAWTDEDRQVVATFARQAALAVRNVRLTEHLATHAAEISASRTRLVKAQELERRRIERNIHDGVQQDLVALIGLAGQIRALDQTQADREQDLVVLQAGLTRVLDDLRDLARGIHPSLLSDKGLLTAVEALTARHPIPVDLRADPGLRDLRFAEEAEAACYFTIAEALANSLKHARAERVEVTLACSGDVLEIVVRDDGDGFDARDPARPKGQGLTGMQDRFAALDGSVHVQSSPGEGTTVAATIAVSEAIAS